MPLNTPPPPVSDILSVHYPPSRMKTFIPAIAGFLLATLILLGLNQYSSIEDRATKRCQENVAKVLVPVSETEQRPLEQLFPGITQAICTL